MGCTSSAPNTAPPNSHTADKSIQFEEDANESPSIEVDVADIDEENQTDETKVLPSCDSFEQTVQLVRNNISSNSFTTEKDVPANGHVIETEIVNSTTDRIKNDQDDVKIPKLELFMDKVFETNHHLNHEADEKVPESEKTDANNEEPLDTTEKTNDDTNKASEPESSNNPENEVENNKVEEETEEASPSQSQCSRATRWEALADIAAELPPSLAVDPVTGQIYQIALHK